MPRLLGIDIPKEKRIEIALTYVYGIGRVSSNKILKSANISPDVRARDLTEEEISSGLKHAIRDGNLIPVFAGSVSKDIGITELMNGVVNLFCHPLALEIVS